MLARIFRYGRRLLQGEQLSPLAISERSRDRATPLESDPGIEASVQLAVDWLRRAQDESASHDGGVSRAFHLNEGWQTSYPETTGYIIPTMLECARQLHDDDLRERARRMLDFCVAIQFPDGGFQGGIIGAEPRVPVTFNTGQILLGLAAGAHDLGERYVEPMRRAADWLATTQDADGCWRKFRTPFAAPNDKAYETHVSWGLYEAARVERRDAWIDAANRQLRWAISRQRTNGWFADNDLGKPAEPLTHTIGYVLRGVIEGYLFTRDEHFLDSALRCAKGVLPHVAADGRLPGRFDADWRPTVSWVCLTGSAQIAHCWLQLYALTGDAAFRDAAYRTLAFVRRSVRRTGDPGLVGGVKGSSPVEGGYSPFELPNWAAKFLIDANLLERETRARDAQASSAHDTPPRARS